MAISVVQSVSATGAAVTSITTGAISTTTGNLVVVHCGYFDGTEPTLSDTTSATWTSVQNIPGGGVLAINWGLSERYSNAITGNASHTFTETMGSAAYMTMAVQEVTGQASSNVLDKIASSTSANEGPVTSHTTPSTSTTTQANELLLGGAAQDAFSTAVFSSSAPWTQDKEVNSASTNSGILVSNQVVSSTGAYAFVYATDINQNNNKMISTWKAAAAAASLPPRSLFVKQAVNRASTY